MEIVNLIYVLIFINYTIFIGLLLWGFFKIKTFHFPLAEKEQKTSSENHTGFSVLIPFRNEAQNLPHLLESFCQLRYPKEQFELILINDGSEDDSETVIHRWRMANPWVQLTLIDNVRITQSPKKDAITRALTIAKYPWIITTDADCTVLPEWLSVYDAYIRKNEVKMVAGTVTFPNKGGFCAHFQQMDMLSLQGATIGGFGLKEAFMCSGANFAYTRSFFVTLKGYHGNNHIASGDDVFLLQKAMANEPEKVHFLKAPQAIVTTKPEKSWLKLFRQRVRWASKTAAYQSDFAKGLAVIVFLTNFALLCGLLLIAFNLMNWKLLLVLFLVKCTVDCMLMYQTNKFLNMSLLSILTSSLIYPFFSSFVALYSFMGGVSWKRDTKYYPKKL